MFDFGFSELVVIGIVMLIVVGPEREAVLGLVTMKEALEDPSRLLLGV